MRESIDLNYYAKSNWRRPQIYKSKLQTMTSLSYGRIFCLESQKKDGTGDRPTLRFFLYYRT